MELLVSTLGNNSKIILRRMDLGVVYLLYSEKCDDFYIGASINYKKALKEQRRRARGWQTSKLYNKMREVGVDNWIVEEIEVNVPYNILLYRQQYYIDTLSPNLNHKNAVNLCGYDYYGNPKKNENEPKKNENEPQ